MRVSLWPGLLLAPQHSRINAARPIASRPVRARHALRKPARGTTRELDTLAGLACGGRAYPSSGAVAKDMRAAGRLLRREG